MTEADLHTLGFITAGHQTHAFRIVQYFLSESQQRARIFPGEYFAAGAEELGPHSENIGPCLVRFTGLELSPAELLSWFQSSLLRRHVTRLYWLHSPGLCLSPPADPPSMHAAPPTQDPAVCMDEAAAPSPASQHGTALPDPGESVAHGSTHGEECVSGSAGAPASPIITNREELLQDISAAAELQPGMTLRLYCSPKSLEKYLQEHLPERFQLHPQDFTHVLQAVQGEGWIQWSIVPASWLYRQSVDEAKALPDSVAHAVNKLDEALWVSGLGLHSRLAVAIDLGAAPGAWSMYLASRADLVIAVDPAALHPYAQLDNITHLRKKAEDAMPDITALLAGRQVDILTCDMNMHPLRASQAIHSLLPFLRPGGTVILTLKFTGTGKDRSKTRALMMDLYKGILEGGSMMWLLANTVCEQTWVAVKCSPFGKKHETI